MDGEALHHGKCWGRQERARQADASFVLPTTLPVVSDGIHRETFPIQRNRMVLSEGTLVDPAVGMPSLGGTEEGEGAHFLTSGASSFLLRFRGVGEAV